MPNVKATRVRSDDIRSSAASFSELLLSDAVLAGLAAAGFERPSPVQLAAIPPGRFGADLVVQAKSGTGKTAVFGVVCAEGARSDVQAPQALIVAPTREIALQIRDVVSKIGSAMPGGGLRVEAFVGGLPEDQDRARLSKPCQVVVGSPGRVRSLIESGAMGTGAVRLLVLDEADSLMGDRFLDDVGWIHDALPPRKQVMAFSATYSAELLGRVEALMRSPQRVLLCSDTVALRGVRQYYFEVPEGLRAHEVAAAKEDRLVAVLGGVSFHQAVVFCRNRARATALQERLTAEGFPAAFICGDQGQRQRMGHMEDVRSFRLRVLISTDLVARGVDLDRVNLVVNLDVPEDGATYMHRVGRTGRFGTHGVAVTMASSAELARLQEAVAAHGGVALEPLPDRIPSEYYAYELGTEEEKAALKRLQEAPRGEVAAAPPGQGEAEGGGGLRRGGGGRGEGGGKGLREGRRGGAAAGWGYGEQVGDRGEPWADPQGGGDGGWSWDGWQWVPASGWGGGAGEQPRPGEGAWRRTLEPGGGGDQEEEDPYPGWGWDGYAWYPKDEGRSGNGGDADWGAPGQGWEAPKGPPGGRGARGGEEGEGGWVRWCEMQQASWAYAAGLPPPADADAESWDAFIEHCGRQQWCWWRAKDMPPPRGTGQHPPGHDWGYEEKHA